MSHKVFINSLCTKFNIDIDYQAYQNEFSKYKAKKKSNKENETKVGYSEYKQNLENLVSDLTRGLHNSCKVIWN